MWTITNPSSYVLQRIVEQKSCILCRTNLPHYLGSIRTQHLTAEAGSAGAHVAAGHVLTGASVHARVGQTLVDVDVAAASRPAGLTHASVAGDLVQAAAVDTGVAGALVVFGEAGGVTESLRAETDEAVHAVDAGAAVVTRV